jgi:prepilin-type processing-associated H-X9-DG protein
MKNRPSTGKAAIWGLILGILMGWVPVVGAILVGVVAGKKARTSVGAVLATLLPAALYAAGFYWLSSHPLKLGGQETVIGELGILGPITAACMIGSALVAARPGPGRLFGLLALIAGLAYAGLEGAPIYSAGKAVWSLLQKPPEATKVEAGKNCPENLTALYNAAMNYADGHDGKLPPADKWMDELKANVKDEQLRCPAVLGGYGYSMNPEVGGKSLVAVADKSKTPLFYDSTDTAVDAHASVDSVPKPGRHGGQNNIIYLDGQVKTESK